MNDLRKTGIILLVLLCSAIRPIEFDSAGWLSGYTYRISHTISGQPGAGIGYIMRFYVMKGSGTSSGEYVYLNDNCQNDLDDVRFTASDGTTLYGFWRELTVSGTVSIYWVKIDADLNSTQSIYIYSGNPDATDGSDPSMFLLFDHFESWNASKWDDAYTQTGTRVVENSYLKLTVSTGTNKLRTVQSDESFPKFTSVRFKLKEYLWRADRRFILGYYDDPANFHVSGNGVFFYQDVSSQGYVENEENGLYTGGAYDGLYKTDTMMHTRNDSWSRFWTRSYYLSYPSYTDVFIDGIGDYPHDVLCPITFSIEALSGTLEAYFWIDWVFVRPWIQPEPSHGSYGNQQAGAQPPFYCWQLRLGLLFFGLGAIFLPIVWIGTQKPKAITVIRLIVVIIFGFAMLLCSGSLECVD